MSSEFFKEKWRSLFTVLAIGVLVGVVVDRLALGTSFLNPAGLNLPLISEAWRIIQWEYVDRAALNSSRMTYGAVEGMVDALGDTGHSRFLSPEMVKKLKQMERNNYVGIGTEVQIKDGHIVIVAPLQDSPAQKAGLEPGDVILRVNGINVTGMTLDQVIERITGRAGSQVTLSILSHGSEAIRDVVITRSKIVLHEVTWQRLPDIPLVQLHIANFGKGVTEDLKRALHSISVGDARGLILDLRNNPGGLLSEAVATSSQFLSSGNVLLEKDARGKIKPIPVESGGAALHLPMVVLVNRGSASAAEIVTGALQDAGRAKVVGEATFGTGTVLAEFRLSDGSALMLAVKEWLTPKGHLIWHKGITPDVTVSLPADEAPIFPESGKRLLHTPLRDLKDTQLVEAIELLDQ